jgi:hypothetical protein
MTDTPPDSDGGILKANTFGPEQVQVGMPVAAIDGEQIGTVKQVRDDAFLVDRPMARDLWIPFTFVLATEEYSSEFRAGPDRPTSVVLTLTAGGVDDGHFPHA